MSHYIVLYKSTYTLLLLYSGSGQSLHHTVDELRARAGGTEAARQLGLLPRAANQGPIRSSYFFHVLTGKVFLLKLKGKSIYYVAVCEELSGIWQQNLAGECGT